MAWSWLHSTAAGYKDTLRERLDNKSDEWLAKALADTHFEKNQEKESLTKTEMDLQNSDYLVGNFSHQMLVDKCFKAALSTNTCDNGAWKVWIDPEGYHRIYMGD
jgi:hypothetical protein